MIPRTIVLEYRYGNYMVENTPGDGELTLPERLHTRGCTVVSSVERDGQPSSLLLRSEYDAIYDIIVELELDKRGVGIVQSVWFEESK